MSNNTLAHCPLCVPWTASQHKKQQQQPRTAKRSSRPPCLSPAWKINQVGGRIEGVLHNGNWNRATIYSTREIEEINSASKSTRRRGNPLQVISHSASQAAGLSGPGNKLTDLPLTDCLPMNRGVGGGPPLTMIAIRHEKTPPHSVAPVISHLFTG